MISSVRIVGRRIRTLVSTATPLYLLAARPAKGDWLVSRASDIVIEGFPRSGNSFAEAAFRQAQTKQVSIAHHCHAAAQIIAAAKWGIPCLVVIREPLEAGRSLIMHQPELFSAQTALWEYCVFHEAIARYKPSFVLASFEVVIRDFGAVVESLNARFGTNFDRFEHSAAGEEAAFELLDRLSRLRGTAGETGEPYSPSRSAEEKRAREIVKERIRAAMAGKRVAAMRARAESIYERLMSVRDL